MERGPRQERRTEGLVPRTEDLPCLFDLPRPGSRIWDPSWCPSWCSRGPGGSLCSPTLCTYKQPEIPFLFTQKGLAMHVVIHLAYLTLYVFPLYPTSCRYFHVNFAPMKDLSPNAQKSHNACHELTSLLCIQDGTICVQSSALRR